MVIIRYFILSVLFFQFSYSQKVNWITIEKAQELQKKVPKNIIINNEFNTENQDAGISVASWLNSLSIIQITIPHIITKLIPRKKFDIKYF